jgi:hypothetical protein
VLAWLLPGFRSSAGFSPAKAEARGQIARLEKRGLDRARDTTALPAGFGRLSAAEGCVGSGESEAGQLGG